MLAPDVNRAEPVQSKKSTKTGETQRPRRELGKVEMSS